MSSIFKVVLLLSLAGLAAAARFTILSSAVRAAALRATIHGDLGADSEVAVTKNRERWCLTAEATPSCKEGTIIDLQSAFTSASWDHCGAPPAREEVGCDPNVTEQVFSICHGEQQCAVPPDARLSCADNLQYSVRIVWGCVPGTPRTEPSKLDPIVDKAKAEPEAPSCEGSFEAEMQLSGGKPVSACRNTDNGELAAKACCEEGLSKLEKAMDACQAVPYKDCGTDPALFERRRKKYVDVPADHVCRRMYACSLPGNVTGYVPTVRDCGDMKGTARRACVPEKRQEAGNEAPEPAARESRECVDVNAATQSRLARAKGVSERLAYRIVRARTCFLKDVDDLKEKLKAQQHPDGLWTFNRILEPLFRSDPPKLCVGCEEDPEKAKSRSVQSVVDVNVASFRRLTSVEGIGRSMANRILQARSCFFKDHADFEERFRSKLGNSNLWRFVQDAIDAGEICLKELPKTEDAAEPEPVATEDEEEAEAEEETEEESAMKAAEDTEVEKGSLKDSQEQKVEMSVEVHNVDGSAASQPKTQERVEAAVKDAVVANIGEDFLPSQVDCGVPSGNVAGVVVIVVCQINVAFATMAGEVQKQLASQELAETVAGNVDADAEVPKVKPVLAGAQKVEATPVVEESEAADIKAAFWKLMGTCDTVREDFVGFEHRPDWEVLPFTSKICNAAGCREAMAEFSRKHSRACRPNDNICREAAVWVSELYRGSSDCRELTMAEKMQEDLKGPEAACEDDSCTVKCIQALRDFPGLARGCRSEGCAKAYDALEAMYAAIAKCPRPNAGSTFPLPVVPSGLVQVVRGTECAFAPAEGGWTMTAKDLSYCSYFKPVSGSEGNLGKLVDPRTKMCFGWLHKDGQPMEFTEPGVNGLAIAQCDTQQPTQGDRFSEGYDFFTVWKPQDDGRICLASDDEVMSEWCFDIRTHSGREVVDSEKTDAMNMAAGWTFPLHQTRRPNLFRFTSTDGSCLVVPPNSGWGMGTADKIYCSYFHPVEIETYNPLLRKFKDPRSGLCIGWIHHDGFPGDWMIPGINGPAAAPCLVDGTDRIGHKMDFNSVFQHIPQKNRVCIVTNQFELTPFCFDLA
uniref:Helix-hairpin-helix DNA-binding motif class 1 domain-containing protein n=1 Tax=Alexandrium monilatum TaxID=311494 RepID=A0A7S4RMD5_9DINO